MRKDTGEQGSGQDRGRGQCGVEEREAKRNTESNLHLNLSMIFPPHSVAKAILTANTEILPWPSLFHENRKEKKRNKNDVIWRTSRNKA